MLRQINIVERLIYSGRTINIESEKRLICETTYKLRYLLCDYMDCCYGRNSANRIMVLYWKLSMDGEVNN